MFEVGGPGAVVKDASLESRGSRVRPPLWHSVFKETIPSYSYRFSIVRSLRDRDVACLASNFECCVWRAKEG